MIVRIALPLALVAGAAAAQQQTGAGRAADRFSLDMLAPDVTATPTPEPAATPAVTPTAEPSPTPTSGPAAKPAATLPPPTVPDSTTVTGAPTETALTLDAMPATDPAPAGARAAFTLDTPIRDLIANPASKAVLDKDLPGLSDDENLAKFDRIGLRAFQPMTGGQLTDAMLEKVGTDLAAVGGAALTTSAKPAGGRKSRDDSR